MLINRLTINVPMDEPILIHVLASYRTTFDRCFLGLLVGPLVCYESIITNDKHSCRVVVPKLFRRIIFTLIHTSLIAEHIGDYKTL